MNKRIVLPEGMLKRAIGYAGKGWVHPECSVWAKDILEAALLWQDDELEKMDNAAPSLGGGTFVRGYKAAIKDLRRMFLAPEPEVPEEIKDLLWVEDSGIIDCDIGHNIEIIEAFRRGQKSKG